MQVERIQNNSNYNTQFGARIIKTDYLKAGFKYAHDYALPREQRDFLNALEYIAKDKKMKTFCIRGVEGSTIKPGQARLSQVEIDGHKSYENEGFIGTIDDGTQCIKALKDFIYRHYGIKAGQKVFNQGNRWLMQAEELVKQAKQAKQKGMKMVLNHLNRIERSIKAD